jgi:hypothetical protein
VAVAVLVAVANQRRHRGRLARAGAADEEHDAALAHDDVLEHHRQAEVVEFRDVRGDGPEHHAHACLLHECVDAKAADARRAHGEVALLGRLELLGLLVVHHRACELHRVLGRERLVRYGRHPPVDLQRGRKPGGDEKVGRLLRHHGAQKVVDEFHCLVAFHAPLL